MKVMYENGPAAVTLRNVGVVERGVAVEVEPEQGEQLLKQGWREATAAPSPSPASAAQEKTPPASKSGHDQTAAQRAASKED